MACEASQGKVGRARKINNNKRIRAWGANSYGQLSLGHKEDQLLPREITPQLTVKRVTGGGGHTLLVTDEGRLWTCGSNNKGQLGLGTTNDIPTLTLVSVLEDVTTAAGGWDFSLAVTGSGDLYSWGSNSFMQLGDPTLPVKTTSPSKISVANGEKVADVSAGLRHSVALTVSGNIYCWGHAKKGQCGVIDDSTPVSRFNKPVNVSLPSNCGHVVKIGAGSFHTVALTEIGEVFVWGCNKYGQSTQDPTIISQVNVPYKLATNLFQGNVTEVKTGWTHLIVSTDAGYVFTWGRADYGQLGRQHTKSHDHMPRQVECFCANTCNVKAIECGSEHNLTVTEDQRLYSWGWNEHGICGTGDETNVNLPYLVQILGTETAINIGGGAGHSFMITDCQKEDDKG